MHNYGTSCVITTNINKCTPIDPRCQSKRSAWVVAGKTANKVKIVAGYVLPSSVLQIIIDGILAQIRYAHEHAAIVIYSRSALITVIFSES